MTWDFDNRLVRVVDDANVELGNYNYDYLGKRVRKYENAKTTKVPFKHYRTVSGVATKYYYANGKRIAERNGSNVYCYHSDHLGSSNIVTDSTGAEVKSTLFYPFGATRTETGSKTIAHKFTGQEYDPGTGLYYYGARYYDTRLMRFVSADSLVRDIADPQTFNRYSYVRNNPLTRIDPDGNQDRSISETMKIMQNARNQNIVEAFFNHAGSGIYDFRQNDKYRNDTFETPIGKMNAGQFGNFLAGYSGGYLAGYLGYLGVRVFGLAYNIYDNGSKTDLDLSDAPYITAGALYGAADRVISTIEPIEPPIDFYYQIPEFTDSTFSVFDVYDYEVDEFQ